MAFELKSFCEIGLELVAKLVTLTSVNARVLIDGSSELLFDYAIPFGLDVRPGCRVRIPLRRKSATGTVLSVIEAEQSDFALRELESLIDPEPLITPVLLRTADWIANYYGSSIESVIRSILPEGVRAEENFAKTRRVAIINADITPEVLSKLEKRAVCNFIPADPLNGYASCRF